MAAHKVPKIKEEEDDILDIFWAVLVEDDHTDVFFTGLGQKHVSAVFKLLQSSPAIGNQ